MHKNKLFYFILNKNGQNSKIWNAKKYHEYENMNIQK
jgi:hypothetical protein